MLPWGRTPFCQEGWESHIRYRISHIAKFQHPTADFYTDTSIFICIGSRLGVFPKKLAGLLHFRPRKSSRLEKVWSRDSSQLWIQQISPEQESVICTTAIASRAFLLRYGAGPKANCRPARMKVRGMRRQERGKRLKVR